MGRYAQEFRRSLDDPEGFWREAAADVDWVRPPERILDDSAAPLYRWFPGAECNTCFNCVAKRFRLSASVERSASQSNPGASGSRVASNASASRTHSFIALR